MTRSPDFVKKGQIFICNFEACSNAYCSCGYTSCIKPEIGKSRPVIIARAHKRAKIAIIIPFTTQEPTKETSFTVKIPTSVMPGVLGRKECWALCDMPQTVSLDRLESVYIGNQSHLTYKDSFLDNSYFNIILSKLQSLF